MILLLSKHKTWNSGTNPKCSFQKYIWKEVVVAQHMYYPCNYLEGLTKTTKNFINITGVSIEIQTENVSNMNLEHYR